MTVPDHSLPYAFANLFPEFRADSWDNWRTVLKRLLPQVREFYCVAGRGSGKSRITALLACCYACREYRRVPGENIFVGVFAPDRKQAQITFGYIGGLLKSVPVLANLIVNERADSITLSNGVVIEVITASTSAPRGRSYAVAIIDEAAQLPNDDSANPDYELLRAIRPALARVPGSLLMVVSTPYARRGVLYDSFKRYHAESPDDVLFVRGDTLSLNPLFDARAIAQAYELDPAMAAAEFGAEFRHDFETFISLDVLDACTITGRHELPPIPHVTYAAFCDAAGGSGSDSFTLAISHREQRDGRRVHILDAIREAKPPFSPDDTVEQFAALCKSYRITTITGDRFSGDFVLEAFKRHNVQYLPAQKTKGEIYKDALPLLNSHRVELLDHVRLRAQLSTLERYPSRSGRDQITHPTGGHDDVCNAVCGSLLLASAQTAEESAIELHALQSAAASRRPSPWGDWLPADPTKWRGPGSDQYVPSKSYPHYEDECDADGPIKVDTIDFGYPKKP